MAQDPRNFTVNNFKDGCPSSKNQRIREDTKKREFFDKLGKIGNIEVLNRFGGGAITAGLRTLSKTSDSIRTGDTDSAIIPNSAGYVFETIGINPNAAEKAGQFNPGVLNRATGEAEGIIDQVKRGNFKLDDIPGVFSNLQNLGTLVDGVYTEDDKASLKSIELCGASPYAIDLIKFAPKFKFMFVVEIEIAPDYHGVFFSKADGQSTAKSLAFAIKTSTRPNINIEHEEINMYNFWTRIPKRTVFEPVTMKFYDDIGGKAHRFYTAYLKNISPITRTGGMDATGTKLGGRLGVPWLEAHSMNPNDKRLPSTASVGALKGKNTSIITEIRVYHIIKYGREMTVYHYHHPKILSMNLDELDMANSGDGSEIELQFGYDAFTITPAFTVEAKPGTLTDITGGDTALYPIVPNYLPFNSEQGTEYAGEDEYEDEGDGNGFGGGDMPDPGPDEAELTDTVTEGVSGRTLVSSTTVTSTTSGADGNLSYDAATNTWKTRRKSNNVSTESSFTSRDLLDP